MMEKPRRSAGMKLRPLTGTPLAPPLPEMPPRPKAATPQPVSTSLHAKPKMLMTETSSPRPGKPVGPEIGRRREAFRTFMTTNRLRPTQWAKDAQVPLGEVMGYLTGKSRMLSPEIVEKLARAAKAAPEAMFQ